LERWPADPYEVTVFHQGDRDRSASALRESAAKANVNVREVDLSADVPAEDAKLWRQQKAKAEGKLPWVVLRFPAKAELHGPVAWAGPAGDWAKWVDSPKRQDVARCLLAGDSAVWVLVECGDQKKDDLAARVLGNQLDQLQRTLKLPVLLENDPDLPGPSLLSDLPLKLAFSVIRVKRDEPAERSFVTMLEHSESHPMALEGPAVFPVMGRGRVLCGLSGNEIGERDIGDVARFVVGACSCKVKELNPGSDLLMAVDWEGILGGSEFAERIQQQKVDVPEPVLPPPTTRPALTAVAVETPNPVAANVAGDDRRPLKVAIGVAGGLTLIFGWLAVRGKAVRSQKP
jgi:hypothetical protein